MSNPSSPDPEHEPKHIEGRRFHFTIMVTVLGILAAGCYAVSTKTHDPLLARESLLTGVFCAIQIPLAMFYSARVYRKTVIRAITPSTDNTTAIEGGKHENDPEKQRDFYLEKCSIAVDDMKEVFGMKIRMIAVARYPPLGEFYSKESVLMAHFKLTGSPAGHVNLSFLVPAKSVQNPKLDEFIMPESRWNPSSTMVYFACFDNDTDLTFFGIYITEIHETSRIVDFRVCQLSYFRYLLELKAQKRLSN